MKIIDISWPMSADMTTYKNNQPVAFDEILKDDGNMVRLSSLHCSSHTGTHVESSAHFIKDGAFIESIKLEQLIGKCRVLDFMHITDKITVQDLEKETFETGDIVLFKTKNSELSPTAPFNFEFVYLDPAGAQYLVERGVKTVGIDYLGIEHGDPTHPTHITLLKNNIPIIEGLRLAHVEAGAYTFYCLPLKVSGLEAALARAILIS